MNALKVPPAPHELPGGSVELIGDTLEAEQWLASTGWRRTVTALGSADTREFTGGVIALRAYVESAERIVEVAKRRYALALGGILAAWGAGVLVGSLI